MKHALDNHKTLGEQAFAAKLWIDGTAPDDTYQGDATQGPWVVFDIAAQTNIAGPFSSDQEARDALVAIIARREPKPPRIISRRAKAKWFDHPPTSRKGDPCAK